MRCHFVWGGSMIRSQMSTRDRHVPKHMTARNEISFRLRVSPRFSRPHDKVLCKDIKGKIETLTKRNGDLQSESQNDCLQKWLACLVVMNHALDCRCPHEPEVANRGKLHPLERRYLGVGLKQGPRFPLGSCP